MGRMTERFPIYPREGDARLWGWFVTCSNFAGERSVQLSVRRAGGGAEKHSNWSTRQCPRSDGGTGRAVRQRRQVRVAADIPGPHVGAKRILGWLGGVASWTRMKLRGPGRFFLLFIFLF